MIKTIISIVTLISICFLTYFYFENRYALAKDMEKIENRLDYKIEKDVYNTLRERLWKLEEKYEAKPADPGTKQEMKELEEEIDLQKSKVKQLQEQIIK